MITLIEHLKKNYSFDAKDFNKKHKSLNVENLILFLIKIKCLLNNPNLKILYH